MARHYPSQHELAKPSDLERVLRRMYDLIYNNQDSASKNHAANAANIKGLQTTSAAQAEALKKTQKDLEGTMTSVTNLLAKT